MFDRVYRHFFGRGAALWIPILAFAVYWDSLGGAFVWDDHPLISQNTSVTLGTDFSKILTSDFFSNSETDLPYGYYRPMVALSYMLDYRLWGNNPLGFHLSNVLLHGFCSLLVYFIALRLRFPPHIAWISGVLFAVHPIHVENVAWISGRTDVISFAFAGVAFLLHFRLSGERSGTKAYWSYKALALLAFSAAILAKEMAVVVVFWILLVHLVLEEDPLGKTLTHLLPYIAVISTYILCRFWVLELPLPYQEIQPRMDKVVLSIPLTVMRYLGWMLFPFDLCPYVQNAYAQGISDVRFIVSMFFATAAAYFLWKRGRETARLRFLVYMLLVSFMPIVNIIRPAGPVDMGAMMAERFCYFPSFPFSIILGLVGMWLVGQFKAKQCRRIIGMSVTAIVLAVYSIGTFAGSRIWRDEQTLFKTAIEKAPKAPLMFACLANHYLRRQDFQKADDALKKAEELSEKNYVATWRILWYVMQSRFTEAVPLQEKMVANAMPQTRAISSNNLAYLYRVTGKTTKAKKILTTLVSEGKAHADVHYNLAELYITEKKWDRARDEFLSALSSKPFDLKIGTSFARMEINLGRYEQAEDVFGKLMNYYPENVGLFNNIGVVKKKRGDVRGAMAMFEKSIELDADSVKARLNLAKILQNIGRNKEADYQFTQIIKIAPGSREAKVASALRKHW